MLDESNVIASPPETANPPPVLYMYNPFSLPVIQAVIARVNVIITSLGGAAGFTQYLWRGVWFWV